jgi:hypothetical protein
VVVYTAAPGSRSAKALEELTATCAGKLPLTGRSPIEKTRWDEVDQHKE